MISECHFIAVMRNRTFMDAAQAEKMREREAMENVKLLYHDNMIEMTSVSSSWATLSLGHITLHNSVLTGFINVVLTLKRCDMSLSFITTHSSIVLHHEHLFITQKNREPLAGIM